MYMFTMYVYACFMFTVNMFTVYMFTSPVLVAVTGFFVNAPYAIITTAISADLVSDPSGTACVRMSCGRGPNGQIYTA